MPRIAAVKRRSRRRIAPGAAEIPAPAPEKFARAMPEIRRLHIAGWHVACSTTWCTQCTGSDLRNSANERERVSLVSGVGHGAAASEPAGESEGRKPLG